MKILFCLLSVMGAGTLYAQKVGMVDEQRVMKSFKEAQRVERELQSLIKSWEDTAVRYQQFIAERAERFKSRINEMTSAERAAELDTLMGMRRLLDSYNTSKSNTESGEFWQERTKRYAPVLAKFKSAVAAVSKREKIDLVLNMNTCTLIGNAPDITDAVIKELEK